MKGKTNNPYGRPAGIPNKLTKDLRKIIEEFVKDNIENVKQDFQKLEPKDRTKIFVDLLQYVIPKYQSINAMVNMENIENHRIEIGFVPCDIPLPESEEEILKQIDEERKNDIITN